jgi:hypothetical protein
MGLPGRIISDITDMIGYFGDVVLKGESFELSADVLISLLLIGMGGLLTTLSLAIFGVLTVGAIYGVLTDS